MTEATERTREWLESEGTIVGTKRHSGGADCARCFVLRRRGSRSGATSGYSSGA